MKFTSRSHCGFPGALLCLRMKSGTKPEYKTSGIGQKNLFILSNLRMAGSSDLLRGDGGERCECLPLHLAADTHRLNGRIQRDVGRRQNLAGGDVTCQLDMMR